MGNLSLVYDGRINYIKDKLVDSLSICMYEFLLSLYLLFLLINENPLCGRVNSLYSTHSTLKVQ